MFDYKPLGLHVDCHLALDDWSVFFYEGVCRLMTDSASELPSIQMISS